MQSPSRQLSLADLNTHLVCVLCGGYLIDATTIIECLHSFCRTCIFHYLANNKYCPICEVQVHKTKPLVNVRADKTMQSLVYKLVPGLQKEEMRRRQEFYSRNSEHDNTSLMSATDDRVNSTVDHRVSSQLDRRDCISICLELCDRLPPLSKTGVHHESIIQKYVHLVNDRRYLFCPARMTIGHLKRFLRCKLDLPTSIEIGIFHSNVTLQELYTLWDVANIYTWRRTEPLKLYYVMYSSSQPSSTKSSCSVGTISRQENFRQRREFDATINAAAEDELAVKRVNKNSQPIDTVDATMNWLNSGSASDTADVNCNVGLLTIAKPHGPSELCSEKFVTEETVETVAVVQEVDPFERGAVEQAVDAVMSDFVSPGLETQCIAAVEACSEPDNDGSSSTVGSVTNNDSGSVVHHDGVLQNDAAVSPELSNEEKIGFEPDAITATDQWPARLPVVERKVKRLHSEVQRLMLDEDRSGRKREIRTSGRFLGGVRRKTRRSPLLRLRTTVSIRTSTSSRQPNKLTRKLNGDGN